MGFQAGCTQGFRCYYHKGNIKQWTSSTRSTYYNLESNGFLVNDLMIEVFFEEIEIFSSFKKLSQDTNLLHQTTVSYAKEVVHLAAAEEHREKFSLTKTDSVGNKEIYLPGVHSDIGGGYPDNYLEDDLVVFKGSHQEVEDERSSLISAGWFTLDQITVVEPSRRTRGPARSKVWKLKIVNRVVRNEYDQIPLHIMAEFVRRSGINLISDPEDDNAVEDDFLLPLLDKLKSYANARSSKVEEWQGNSAWLLKLRNEYLHFSAHYNDTGMQPRFINGIRKRLVYEG
jgi:hypothetical protein